MNKKLLWILSTIGAVAVLLVGLFVWPGLGGDNDSSSSVSDGPCFVVAPVELRTLSD